MKIFHEFRLYDQDQLEDLLVQTVEELNRRRREHHLKIMAEKQARFNADRI